MGESKRRKPTGEIGSSLIDMAKKDNRFTRVRYPTSKPEIERIILALTLASATPRFNPRQHYGLVGDPIQNAEADFDFTLPTESGNTYLDLLEIALLEDVRGSFDGASTFYSIGQRADAVLGKVVEKSASYGPGPHSGVHLLLYTTDYRFSAALSVADLLVHLLHAQRHCFRSVVYAEPQSESSAYVRLLPVAVGKAGQAGGGRGVAAY